MMNKTDHYQMAHVLYLLEKSRGIRRHEPLWIRQDQTDYERYCHSIMNAIENRTMQAFEIDAHLWALAETHKRRISKIKDRRVWSQMGLQR